MSLYCTTSVCSSNPAVRVTATDEISVQAANINFHSSDAFLALPITSLGTRYYTMSYVYTGESLLMQGPSELAVVAVFPNTGVEILLPSDDIVLGYEGYGVVRDGKKLTFTLAQYETYQVGIAKIPLEILLKRI